MTNFRTQLTKPSVIAFISVLGFALVATAGSLTPAASPAGTMNTLKQIWDSIASPSYDSSLISANANGSLIGILKSIDDNAVWASVSPDIYNLNTGNVGIGTTNPETKLELVGTASVSALYIDGNEWGWPLRAPDGSAGAPSYSFTNDTDAGLARLGSSIYFLDSSGSTTVGYNLDAASNFANHFIETPTGSATVGVAPDEVGLYAGTGILATKRVNLSSTRLDIFVNASISGNFGPTPTNTYNLGSSANRWRDLYLGTGTLYLGAAGDQASASYDTTNDALEFGINGARSLLVDATNTNTALGYEALRVNAGTNNAAFGWHGLYSNTTGSNNTALGSEALHSNTTGSANTAVGESGLYANTTGGNNTAVGYSALDSNTTGFNNIAIGRQALDANTSGGRNTAVGYSALFYNSTASNNTALGYTSLFSNTTGASNTALGSGALRQNVTGSDNVAVGASAGYSFTGSGGVFIGRSAGNATTTGLRNTALGYEALMANTTASNNTALGYQALTANTTGGQNIAVGSLTLDVNTTGSNNIAVGHNALGSNTTGGQNIAVGLSALAGNTTGGLNTAIGSGALDVNSTGQTNTAIGYNTLGSNTTGVLNVALGGEALFSNTTGSDNVAIGASAGYSNTTADAGTFVGYNAGRDNTTGTSLTAIGAYSLRNNTTGTFNSALGSAALMSNTTGLNNTALGAMTLWNNTTGEGNSAVGEEALPSNTTGNYNNAVGYHALNSNTTGNYNNAVGNYALFSNATSYYNNAVGTEALFSGTGAANNAFGYQALRNTTTGTQNSALGHQALYTNTAGDFNAAVGSQALYSNSTGNYNAALGYQALYSNTSSFNNAIGFGALYTNAAGFANNALGSYGLVSNTTGTFNAAIGHESLYTNTTGARNNALGYRALYWNSAGDNNIAIGDNAGFNALGSGNVFLGYNAGYSETGSNTLWIDNQSTASSSAFLYGELDSDWLRIGANASISGNFGPTTTNTYDLGSQANRWRSIYVSSGSFHIGTSGNEAVIDYDTAGEDYLAFKPDGVTASFVMTDTGYMGIGKTNPTTNLDISGSASISGSFELGTPLISQGLASPTVRRPVFQLNRTNYSSGTGAYTAMMVQGIASGSDNAPSAGWFLSQTSPGNANTFTGTLGSMYVVAEHLGTGPLTEAVALSALAYDRGNGGTTTTAISVRGQASTLGTGTAVTNAIAFHARNSFGTGNASISIGFWANRSAVTSATLGTDVGLLVDNMAGGTNNIGILISSGSGTLGPPVVSPPSGNWAIYNDSARDNYFNSNLGIGTIDIGNTLEIAGTASISGATSFNGVTYSWPSVQGGAGQLLQNNGSGTLSWATVAGTGSPSATFGPALDNTYDLGSPNLRWRSLYLGPGSLHISSTTGTSGAGADYTDAMMSFTGSDLTLSALPVGAGASGSINLTTGTGGKNIFLSQDGNVGIGTTTPLTKLNIEMDFEGYDGIRLSNTNTGDSAAQVHIAGNASYSVLVNTGNAWTNGVFGTQLMADMFGIVSYANNGLLLESNPAAPMLFATNDTERMRITPDGFVGVATQSPDELVTVYGGNVKAINYADDVSFILKTAEAACPETCSVGSASFAFVNRMNANRLDFTNSYNTTTNTLMTLTEGGFLGIGSTSPMTTLAVEGSLKTTGDLLFGSDAYPNGYGTLLPPDFSFGSAEVAALFSDTITGSADFVVGIGNSLVYRPGSNVSAHIFGQLTDVMLPYDLTQDISNVYDVTGGSFNTYQYSPYRINGPVTALRGWTRLSGAGGTTGAVYGVETRVLVDADSHAYSATGVRVQVDGSNALVVSGLDIATAEASGSDSVVYGIQLQKPFLSGIRNASTSYGIFIPDYTTIGDNAGYNIYSSGSSGVNWFEGTASIGGNVFLSGVSAIVGTDDFLCLDPTTKEVTYSADCSASSIRFKEHVRDLEHGLDWVQSLRPVTFDWKETGSPSLGFIAEEVEQITPLLALYQQDGELFSVNYKIMTAVLAKAIQEQQAMIEAIRAGTSSDPLPLLADDTSFLDRIVRLFKDLLGIEFSAGKVKVQELCLDDVCVNKEQLRQLLENGGVNTPAPAPENTIEPTPTPDAESSPGPAPEATESVAPAPTETPVQPPADTPTEPPPAEPSQPQEGGGAATEEPAAP